MNRLLILVLSLAAGTVTGCAGIERSSSPTSPSAGGNNALMGSWTSASSLIPTPGTCTAFKWDITEQSGTSAKGSFSATCPGDLRLTGTAQGAFTSTSAIAWTADGNATAPGLTSCAIKLAGTATLGTDSIIVPYKGTTCLGAVEGIETLRKR